MYALHLSAKTDETNKEYSPKQTYQLFMIVKTTSEKEAVKKAEQILQEKKWFDIKLQQISEGSKEKDKKDEINGDYYLYVLSDTEINKLAEYKKEAKYLHKTIE